VGNWLKTFIIIFCASVAGLLLQATPLDVASQPDSSLDDRMLTVSAQDALENGFPEIAEHLYTQKLESSKSLSTAERNASLTGLISSLIAQERYEEAQALLSSIEDTVSENGLQSAIVNYNLENYKAAQETFQALTLETLPQNAYYWYYLTGGLIQLEQPNERSWYGVITDFITFDTKSDKKKRAVSLLNKALTHSRTPYQTAQAEAILFRIQIFSEPVDESLILSLKKKLDQNEGKPERFLYLKEYSIALDAMGKKEEALLALEEALERLSPSELEERPTLLLLVGLIAGEQTSAGNVALKSLLYETNRTDLGKIALSILNSERNIKSNSQEYLSFISYLIEDPYGHPLRDALYYSKAQAYYVLNKHAEAELEARVLLEKFPGSEYRTPALWLLAKIAWSKNPPSYRLVATYLNTIRAGVSDPYERAWISQMIADSYFKNKDFENASEIYKQTLENAPEDFPKGTLLFQKVVSDISAKQLEKAKETLDDWGVNPSIDNQNRWRAEWNLITALKKENNIDNALQRLNKKLAEENSEYPSPELVLRLMWLKAQLSMEAGDYQVVPSMADYIINRLDLVDTATMDNEQQELIAGHTLLLKGQALILSGEGEQGIGVLEVLRTKYPQSNAAIQSYLIEARHYAASNNTVNAQHKLIDLVNLHPDAEHAPIALFEAAINAESRGTPQAYRQALLILERIVEEYPKHFLKYYARLKQADILREMNNFGAAQLVYENLLHQEPEHPEYYYTELARGNCLLAQGSKEAVHYKEAESIFEHLYELPNLKEDLQVEAGYKLGFSLMRQNNPKRAKEIYWNLVSRFLINRDNAITYPPKAKYWIARSIFELANLFEEESAYERSRAAYTLILEYNLPGQSLAKEKIQSTHNAS